MQSLEVFEKHSEREHFQMKVIKELCREVQSVLHFEE